MPRASVVDAARLSHGDGASLFIRDVTRLRDLEQELRIAEMRFQASGRAVAGRGLRARQRCRRKR